ncbi:hypothetical protein [Streptomyces sp. NPDC088557]|uniref:hypothetical protein n=1 Tax=Streptomyces sp. NPDC088557 TaxID=3365867 RepID=UPI003823BE15
MNAVPEPPHVLLPPRTARRPRSGEKAGRRPEEAEAADHHCVRDGHTPQEAPALAAVVVRQERVRRDLGARAFPDIDEEHQHDEAPTSLEEVRTQRRRARDR